MRAETPVRRAIAIVLAGDGVAAIDDLRRRYDPLAAFLPAHVTLVFPFASTLRTPVPAAHMRAVVGRNAPFSIELRDVIGHGGVYLFLSVKRGDDELSALHARLYTGFVAPYLDADQPHLPHVTVSRPPNSISFGAALAHARTLGRHFNTAVRDICAYTIAADGRRTIVCRVSLDG